MLKTIQAGRGIAALAVTAFHLSIGLGDERYLGHRVFDTFTWRLNLGVDFFFVLSGFIIMMSHFGDIDRPDRIGNFVQKRFVRIYPIYWLYLSVFLVLIALGFGSVPQVPNTFREWLTSYSLVRFETFQTPIAPAWTLFHEIVFYTIFASLILSRRVGIVLFAIWVALCAVVPLFTTFAHFSLASTLFSTINLDFAIGIAAFLFMRRLKGDANIIAILVVGCLLLVGSYLYNLHATESAFVTVPYGISFGMILAAISALELSKGFKVPAFLVLLGNASYSIYLIHEAFEGLFIKIFIRINNLLHFGEPFIYFGVLVGSVAAGCVAHLVFEKPLLAAIRKYTRGSKPPTQQTAAETS